MLIITVGLLSGAGVLSRTMVGELSDKSNRVQGERFHDKLCVTIEG